MEILVSGETSKLRSVIIGIADSLGNIPSLKELYDPKSIENLNKGTYPLESDMVKRIRKFCCFVEEIQRQGLQTKSNKRLQSDFYKRYRICY